MRARNIKPGFFTNEELAACSPLARLLFAGLWCIADREGRLEDRPKRIKAQVLPYDDAPIEALLMELDARGFIQRYTAGESKYILVPGFARHQHPHVREPASRLPAPGEHRASTGPEPVRPGGFSDSLIPDSPIPDPGEEARGRARETTATAGEDEGHIASTAEVLTGARFVGDDLAAVTAAVARSFALVPGFPARDGPALAVTFVGWKGYRRSPPDDWFTTWVKWLRTEVADREQGRRGGGRESGDEVADAVARRGYSYNDAAWSRGRGG